MPVSNIEGQFETQKHHQRRITVSEPEILIQRAEKAIEEFVGAVLIPVKQALRIQKVYEKWKESHPEAADYTLPQPESFVPVHPPFLDSVIRRLRKTLDQKIEPNTDIVQALTVRHKNVPVFNEAFVKIFEEIETDDTFDSAFLLQNISEEFNRAIKAICDKEKKYKIDEDIQKQYEQHNIDNDDLSAFIFSRLLEHREVKMAIRLKDYQKVIRTFAFFKKTFLPILIKKLGEDRAMMLLELIKKYCDPKTESITMYNLIAACDEFHRLEESQAGGKN